MAKFWHPGHPRWICDICKSDFPSKKAAEKCEVKHFTPTIDPVMERKLASAFVREEMKNRKGRSREQAIAIGFSRARRSGLRVPKK